MAHPTSWRRAAAVLVVAFTWLLGARDGRAEPPADPAESKPAADDKPGAKAEAAPKATRLHVYILTGGNERESEPVVVVFRRTGPNLGELPVRYQVTGSAEEGADYRPVSGIVIFPPGKRIVTLQLQTLDDLNVEDTETINVKLLPPKRAAAHDVKPAAGAPGEGKR